jgi:hypothetical protein
LRTAIDEVEFFIELVESPDLVCWNWLKHPVVLPRSLKQNLGQLLQCVADLLGISRAGTPTGYFTDQTR